MKNLHTKKNIQHEIEKSNIDLDAKFQIYGKHLGNRNYIHSKATKEQLLKVYEEIINWVSDNR